MDSPTGLQLRYIPPGLPDEATVERVRAEVIPGFPGGSLDQQRMIVEVMLIVRAAAIRDGVPLDEAWNIYCHANEWTGAEDELLAAVCDRMKRCFLLPWEP